MFTGKIISLLAKRPSRIRFWFLLLDDIFSFRFEDGDYLILE